MTFTLVLPEIPGQEGWADSAREFEIGETSPSFEEDAHEFLWKERQSTFYNTLEDGLACFFKECFRAIPQVSHVFMDREDPCRINILTFIDELDPEVRDRIYEIETRLMDTLNEAVFNFHVIALDGRPIENIRPTRATNIYTRS